MKYTKLYLLFLLLPFAACDIINPEEEIPSYIEILPFDYVGTDGSTSHKITDAWISVGGQFIGAFDLPKTVPVLANGTQTVLIDAGVKENGLSAAPTIYPFYERYSISVDLTPGEITTIAPSTRYDDALIQIAFNESFDDGLFSFSDNVEKTVVDVREGDGSGLISLDAEDNPSATIDSDPLDWIPIESNIVYMEMDYKSEVPLLIGLIGFDALGDVTYSDFPYGLNPKTEWNKVYFNFSQIYNLLEQNNTSRYRISIRTQIPLENGEFTLENTEIRLDNIKLVTF